MKITKILTYHNINTYKSNPLLYRRMENDSVSFGNSKHINIVGKDYKNKIKIIFADIDGTLSNRNALFSTNTIKSMELLKNKNIPVIITTARTYQDSIPYIKDVKTNPIYTIVLQGGEIIDKNGTPIKKQGISNKAAQKIINWYETEKTQNPTLEIFLYVNDKTYSLSNSQIPWDTTKSTRKINSVEEILDGETSLQKVLIVNTNSPDNVKDDTFIQNLSKKLNCDELAYDQFGAKCYEIRNKNTSKGQSVEALLKILGIKPENAMVIGDSSADISMFDTIRKGNGLAVAMDNADENVKKHANAITSSVADDGFSEVINNIF